MEFFNIICLQIEKVRFLHLKLKERSVFFVEFFECSMIVYKHPITPNHEQNIIFKFSNDYVSDENKNEILKSINVEMIFSDDLEIAKHTIELAYNALKYGVDVFSFPMNFINHVINIAKENSNDIELVQISIDFIYCLCSSNHLSDKLQDNEDVRCFFENILSVLIDVIQKKIAFYIFHHSILSLNLLIKCNKPDFLFQIIQQHSYNILVSALNTLDYFQKSKYDDISNFCQIISDLFYLISTCLTVFNYPENLIDYFQNKICMLTSESDDDPNHIWQISSIRTISILVFWRSEDSFLDVFSSDFVLNNLIKSFSYLNEELASTILCALDNMVRKIHSFVLRLLNHEKCIIAVFPFDTTSTQIKVYYCRLLISVIRRICEYREFNQKNEMLEGAINTIQNIAQTLIPLMTHYIENESFKLRKAATVVLAHLININNSTIMLILLTGNLHLIEELILFMDYSKVNLTYYLIKALRTLCLYGDKISTTNSTPNPFLSIFLENNIIQKLESLLEEYKECEPVSLQIKNFIDEIYRYQQFQEIDEDNNYELDLYI